MPLQRGSSMTTDKHVDPAAAVPAGDEEEDSNLQVAGIVSQACYSLLQELHNLQRLSNGMQHMPVCSRTDIVIHLLLSQAGSAFAFV